MSRELVPSPRAQGIATDKFLFFFIGLRKNEMRRRVATLQADHPGESPEQLARRLIAAQAPLSFLSGVLMHAPMFLPGFAPVLKVLGVAGGASVLMAMHLTLFLEIALLFGRDIDEQARLKEMAAVMAATGLVASTSVLDSILALKPYVAIPAGGVTATTVSELIGFAAIRYYRGSAEARSAVPAASAVN